MDLTTIKVLTVADLHQSRTLYDQLEKAVAWHRPDVVAVVGDCLDLDDAGGRELTREECGRRLNALPSEVVFVRGNHESKGWVAFANAWRSARRMRILNALHEEPFVFGPLIILGFPCRLGDEFHYLEGRAPAWVHCAHWLKPIFREHGPAAGTLWLMHEPPAGTRLSAEVGPMAGRIEWLAAIDRYSPLLVVCGHDHSTPFRHATWHERVHRTQVINTGQKLEGPLHYAFIEFGFPQPTPCVPVRVGITAYPSEQSIDLMQGLKS